jgi:hypothetical protein
VPADASRALEEGARRIGDAFKYVFQDPAWARRALVMGALLLVPVAGAMALFGWQRRVFEAVKSGERKLPEVDFGRDVGRGLPMLLNLATLALLLGLLALALEWVPLVSRFARVVLVLLAVALYPEVLRRSARGALLLVRPGESVRALWGRPAPFAFVAVGTLAALVVAVSGVNLLCIGGLFTMPLGHAIAAHLAARWDIELRR